jgi:alpha-galactosidase
MQSDWHSREHESRIPVSQALLGLTVLLVMQTSACSRGTAPTPAVALKQTAIEVQVAADSIRIQTPSALFVLLPSGDLTSSLLGDGKFVTLDDADSKAKPRVRVNGNDIADIGFDLVHAHISAAAGQLGALGKHIEVAGQSASTGLTEKLVIEVYDDFPTVAVVSASFHNSGSQDLRLDSISMAEQSLNAALSDAHATPYQMWSFHGASIQWGKDDVLPLNSKFSQENPFGAPVETKDDLGRVGGGIPVVAFWTRRVGVALGHIETIPLALSIPVKTQADGHVHAEVRLEPSTTLRPGETYSTPHAFVAVYSGDYYEPLSLWSKIVDREGLSRPGNNDENYAVSWCGWGYESNVTPKQMVDTIPKLKDLGIHWATLDDRWFNNYGDWQPRPDTFPGSSIQKMVKDFHDQGVKVQIWWLPLAVENGQGHYDDLKYGISDVVKEHPDWLVLDKNGKPALMTRNLATLCPAVPEVQAYYKQLTERIIKDWDFDGHKLDNIYSVPRCYNPKHHHKTPMDSVYAMGDVYKIIFQTTRALKADSVTQSCPCGTPPSLAWFRYLDQAVTADPVGSVQVRRRMKMYKALLGPNAAVYGDHVELTKISFPSHADERDTGRDFASTLGTGGVLGTKFTWPDYGPKFKDVKLTPEKEAHWKQWIGLYNEKMLSKGTFRDLYIYGYDNPEGYAIEKDGKMYFAFYVPAPDDARGNWASSGDDWSGELQLRGLGPGEHKVTDYVNGKDLGTVTGPVGSLKAHFKSSLLLEATPVPAH